MYKQRVRSIPAITSTGLNRSSKVSSMRAGMRIANVPQEELGWGENIQPMNLRRDREETLRKNTLPSFPERNKPEVTEDENCVWVIVEFPGHTDISEIQWAEEGNVLSVQSNLLGCSYTNKIALPENRRKRIEVKLHNGLFIVKFEK